MVGAGPVGLIAALGLARRGVPVVVLEAEPRDRVRPGSRAIVLAYPTLRRFDSVLPGLGREISAAGLGVRGYDAYYENRRVFHYRTGENVLGRIAPMPALATSLPQKVTETYLYQACIDSGVEFRWGTAVTGIQTRGDGVGIAFETGETLDVAYVIGADGARSRVRREIGATMQGHTDDAPFIIVDVEDAPDGSTPAMSAMFRYRTPGLDGRNVMHMPFKGGMRIDLQCAPTDDADYLSSPEGIRDWTSRVVDPWYGDHVTWVSTYRFHQVVADSYTDTHHRVLLAGEAAHLFAPWGGRGLNSGVLDATDAATAIADALAAATPVRARELIERCARKRREWGLRNRDVSSRALRIMRASEAGMHRKRALAARLAPVCWPAGAWLANGPTQLGMPPLGSLDFY
ncbi:FAD-dependent monooxygenase [Nocardia sp. NBC_00511]|uniref:FAD-dependent monooxygenase n=1 Tax=Nocardia sp. NBC_00511 TaxID=2903591 RepID=UPI0030E0A710